MEKKEGFRDLAATDVFIFTVDEFSIFGKLKLNEYELIIPNLSPYHSLPD